METIGETRAPTHGDVANVLDLVIQLATMTISQNELIERLTGEKHRPVPISMEDLQKAIADRDEGSARDGSRNQNSLKAVSRIRELFGHRGGSEEGPTKNYRCPSPSLTDHTVVFSKDEIGVDGVDGVEAPPPDPFQSFKNPREEEARMGGSTRCREESIECEGKKEGQGGFGMLPLEAGSQKCVLEKANQSMEKGKIGRYDSISKIIPDSLRLIVWNGTDSLGLSRRSSTNGRHALRCAKATEKVAWGIWLHRRPTRNPP